MLHITLYIQLDLKQQNLEIWRQGNGLILRLNEAQQSLLCGEHSTRVFPLDFYVPLLSRRPGAPAVADSPPGNSKICLKARTPRAGGGMNRCWRQSRSRWKRWTIASKTLLADPQVKQTPASRNTNVNSRDCKFIHKQNGLTKGKRFITSIYS